MKYIVLVRELTGVDADHAVFEAEFLDEKGQPVVKGIGSFPFEAISNAAIAQNNRDYLSYGSRVSE